MRRIRRAERWREVSRRRTVVGRRLPVHVVVRLLLHLRMHAVHGTLLVRVELRPGRRLRRKLASLPWLGSALRSTMHVKHKTEGVK